MGRMVIPARDTLDRSKYGYENVQKKWYDIDWSPTSSGIEYFHTIKIRKIFESKYKTIGYPMRFAQYIGYYSGLGFWVPDGFVVHAEVTKELWLNNPDTRFREVKIMWIGEESIRNIKSLIPFDIDSFGFRKIGYSFSMRKLPLFENLGFYNTMNDDLIKANWDKVKERLQKWGY